WSYHISEGEGIYWEDFENVKRSWHTKDWKDRRKKLLKDKCKLCNTHEGLKIQHLSHPRKYADIETLRVKSINAFLNKTVNSQIFWIINRWLNCSHRAH